MMANNSTRLKRLYDFANNITAIKLHKPPAIKPKKETVTVIIYIEYRIISKSILVSKILTFLVFNFIYINAA
jgi:hypothetical protein